MNYAAAVWSPNASTKSFDHLQKAQNSALRIATGCHFSTPVAHIHQEAKIMPVKEHLDMLSALQLASFLRPSHPSHAIVTAPPGPRRQKETLQSKHIATVSPHLSNGSTDPSTYKATLKSIHTDSVAAAISNLDANPILGRKPPDISPSEIRLTRSQRTTLYQLRSGHCKLLQEYAMRIGLSRTAICPECLFRRHNVHHIFNCDAAPTNLTVNDLWVNPCTVVDFLCSLPSFSPIFPPDPPQPPPPPEPPP